MTKPPTDADPSRGERDAEVLDELDDDAIVAAQSVAHVPKPRQAVRMEDASVVIADDDPAPAPVERAGRQTIPRGLPAYRRHDATIVLKRPQGLRRRPASGLWIWVAAGVVAFAFGGALAMLTRDDGTAGKGEAVSVPTPAPGPVPMPTREVVVASPPLAEPGDTGAGALSPSELPVERAAPRPARPATPTPAPPPPVAPAAEPKKPVSDIPSKI